jgi:predicted kinase
MSVIHFLMGLPASGKTTLAKDLVKDGAKRVSKDDLRAMMNNGEYTPELEMFVIDIRDAIIERAVEMGHDIVVDDTNLNPMHSDAIRHIASYSGAWIDIVKMDTPLEECIKRDAARENPVGEDVIRGMHSKYLSESADK